MAERVTTRSVSGRKGSGFVGALLACAAAWIAARNLSLPTQDSWIFWVPTALWLLTMSALCWWAVLGESPAGVGAAWRWGRIVGGGSCSDSWDRLLSTLREIWGRSWASC
jgi:hypothetical protein